MKADKANNTLQQFATCYNTTPFFPEKIRRLDIWCLWSHTTHHVNKEFDEINKTIAVIYLHWPADG